MQFRNFRIAARGLVIQDNTLLFVSDNGQYWYLPGGRLECGESLPLCVEREIYEETGFIVKAGKLCFVQECLDVKDYIHKLHFYFNTDIVEKNETLEWEDTGGLVKYRRFFTLSEIKTNDCVMPRFLAEGAWLNTSMDTPVYQGSVKLKGFESLTSETL